MLLGVFLLLSSGVLGQDETQSVTFGSSIKLHSLSDSIKHYLWSDNMHFNIQGAGRAQVVSLQKERVDHRIFWTILPAKNEEQVSKPVTCNSEIILVHTTTSLNLSSNRKRGIVSSNQLVTTNGTASTIDPSDIFKLECLGKNTIWMRNSSVKLRHVQTGKYLRSSPRYVYNNGNCPNCHINGDREIFTGDPNPSEDRWAVSDGIFLNSASTRKPLEGNEFHDEL